MAPSLTHNTNKKRNFSTAKRNPPPRKTNVKSTRTVKVTTTTKTDKNNNKDTSPKQMDRKKRKQTMYTTMSKNLPAMTTKAKMMKTLMKTKKTKLTHRKPPPIKTPMTQLKM